MLVNTSDRPKPCFQLMSLGLTEPYRIFPRRYVSLHHISSHHALRPISFRPTPHTWLMGLYKHGVNAPGPV